MSARIFHGLFKNHITNRVGSSSTFWGLTCIKSALDIKVSTSITLFEPNIPTYKYHTCIWQEREKKLPGGNYLHDSISAITLTTMNEEEKSPDHLNNEQSNHSGKETKDSNDKNADVLMKQAKDLADYRKHQKERWRKNKEGKRDSTKGLQQTEQKCHEPHKKRKNKTSEVVQDVVLPSTSIQGAAKGSKSAKERERKNRIRDVVQDVAAPTSSRQDAKQSHKHAREQKKRNHTAVQDISYTESSQQYAKGSDSKEVKSGNHEVFQQVSSPSGSRNKKHRRKRRHRTSEGETPDKKRVSLDKTERTEVSCSPEVIDLDPVSISDSPCTVTNGDILEIQDMDLATSDDEDIVILAPSPLPGTSSEELTKMDQKEANEKEDDVMYMGTVINLIDSPPSKSSESTTLPSSSHNEENSNPFAQGPLNLHPRRSPVELAYHHLQQQQQMPYSTTNPYSYTGGSYSSTSSSMAYSTASGGFHTVSSSFSRFMTSAAFGNAITPSPHPGFPHSSQMYGGGYGPPVRGNAWSQSSTGFGQPDSSFHQSTNSAARQNSSPVQGEWSQRSCGMGFSHMSASFHQTTANTVRRDNSSPDQNRTRSPHKRESHKNKRSKLRDRRWVLVDEELPESQGLMNFTVASYNILAQNLLDDNSQMYDGSQQKYLNWGYRSRNLLEEIEQYCPDILCLQEVKEDHYHRHFRPRLESIGYRGCYKKRTRDMQDGCATFFKTDKFELDVCKQLEYLTRGTSVLDRDNVALIVRLIPRDKSTNNKVVVANTHLLFNPRRGDVKLAQLVLMLAEVDRLAYCGKPGINPLSPTYHPTLIMGDFNSEPQSPLYQLLASGNIEYVGKPMNLFSGQSEGRRGTYKLFDNTALPRKLKITDFCQHEDDVRKRFSCWDSAREGADSIDHGRLWGAYNSSGQQMLSHVDLLQHDCGTYRTFLPLCSVYTHHVFSMQRQRREKEVTTHHGFSKCTVDYIFYASGSRGEMRTQNQQLRLVRRLELLSDTEMKKLGPLPNREVSSDHILLGAAFQLRL